MKHIYILSLLALIIPFQVAKAETLSLETVITQALENSPETARILKEFADTNAEAFEIETLENPTDYLSANVIFSCFYITHNSFWSR